MRCKPGDLAIVVPKVNLSLAGRFCEVISWVTISTTTPEGHQVSGGGGSWLVKFQNPISSRVGMVNYWTVFDSALQPIRPDDLKDTEEETKALETL